MIEQLTKRMELYSNSLQLRSLRQQVIASNMANVDTPGYVGRDFDFAKALKNANGQQPGGATVLRTSGSTGLATTSGAHLSTVEHVGALQASAKMAYNVQIQPSADGNSVDMDQQRANFTDNAIRYESTLRFITGHVKTMLNAIQGQ